ncbi:MAG: hypothetical protein ACRD0J_03730 [Acidimicrobiales bacterium]
MTITMTDPNRPGFTVTQVAPAAYVVAFPDEQPVLVFERQAETLFCPNCRVEDGAAWAVIDNPRQGACPHINSAYNFELGLTGACIAAMDQGESALANWTWDRPR